ncbi:hypothetical protein GCM10023063_25840 [Arthrobacter methylotrophus]
MPVRNEPRVEGAYALANSLPVPPWRNRAMSTIESAPASIPATREAILNPAFATLSVETDNHASASSRSHSGENAGPPLVNVLRLKGRGPATSKRVEPTAIVGVGVDVGL